MIGLNKISDLSNINKVENLPPFVRSYLHYKNAEYISIGNANGSLFLAWAEYSNRILSAFRRGLATNDDLISLLVNHTWTYNAKTDTYTFYYVPLNYEGIL